MHGLHKTQKGLLVGSPLLRQRLGRRVFAAAQLESDLEAIRLHIVEILHSACKTPFLKLWGIRLELCALPLTSYQYAPLVMPCGKLSFLHALPVFISE